MTSPTAIPFLKKLILKKSKKKLYFLDFDGFYAVKGKNGMDLSPIVTSFESYTLLRLIENENQLGVGIQFLFAWFDFCAQKE